MSGRARGLHPLRLTVTAKPLVFGGQAIARRLGKRGLPDWSIAETWECSDVTGAVGVVVGGPAAGRTLREVTAAHGEELMGAGWTGEYFPLLTKFIDAAGSLPVHLHADDEAARRLEGQPNGKTEAWHILDAAPGATALCGVKEGVTPDRLRTALEAQDFGAVLRRLPVRAGETLYVPAAPRTASARTRWSTRSSRRRTSNSTPCAGTWRTTPPWTTRSSARTSTC
ncbi:class I mannose-6-phosphate isomerase [Streptomyces sp. NPDC015501]|uniref:class I mannose-6-phosphate isomerase n=1 Tax=unclassified Streptomyces TaxID=2593676 RepID=UPI0036F75C41